MSRQQFNRGWLCTRLTFCQNRERSDEEMKKLYCAEKSKCQGFPQNQKKLQMLNRGCASRCTQLRACWMQRLWEIFTTCQNGLGKERRVTEWFYLAHTKSQIPDVRDEGVQVKMKGRTGNSSRDFLAANWRHLLHERQKEAKTENGRKIGERIKEVQT